MKQIERIYLRGVEQRRVLQFAQSVSSIMENINDSKFKPYCRRFRHSVSSFAEAIQAPIENGVSRLIDEEDRRRNRLLLELRELAQEQAQQKSNSKAYETLAPTVHYSGMSEPDKTRAINSLLDELCDMYKEDALRKAGAYDIMAELDRSNINHAELLKANEQGVSGHFITRSSAQARERTEHDYQEAVDFINAMLIYIGDKDYGKEADEINGLIRALKNGEDIMPIVPTRATSEIEAEAEVESEENMEYHQEVA
jgi:hypothetical protein